MLPEPKADGSPVSMPPVSDADRGHWEEALQLYRREVAALGEDPKGAALHLEMGRIHEEILGQTREAADCYQRAYELNPQHPAVLHACRRLFALAGQWEMVADMLADEADVVGARERRATLLAERGQVLEEQLQDEEGAEKAYRSALEDWAAEPLAIAALERLLLSNHRYGELFDVYEKALGVANRPERRLPLLMSAAQLAEDRLDKLDVAIAHHEEVLQTDPESALALSALRRLTHRAERWDAFVDVLLRSSKASEDSESAAQFLLAASRVQAERLGQPDRALVSLLKALESTPTDLSILKEIESLYERNHRFQDVAKVLRRELEISSEARERVPILFKLGSMLEEQLGAPEEALPCFAEAVRLMPTHVPARQALGRLYGRTQRWAELAELFEMEIRLEEDDSGKVSKLYKLAELQDVELGQEEAAVQTLRQLLEIRRDYQPARKYVEQLLLEREDWEGLIELYDEECGQTEDIEQKVFLLGRIGVIAEEKAMVLATAQRAYERILEISPRHLSAIRTLARIASKREDWSEVLRMYELEIEATEDQLEIVSVVHRAGVVTEERLGDVDAALAHFEKALSINPTYLPALRSLGRIYGRQQRWEDLVKMYQRELEVTRSPEQKIALLFRVAEVQQNQLEDDQAAVASYDEVLAIDGDNLPALRALSVIHERLGDGEKLVDVLLRESNLQRDPKDRSLGLMRVAELCEERLDRSDRAAELYEEILRQGEGLDASVRALIRIYSAEGMWNALSRALKTAFDHARDDASRAAILVRCAEVAGDRLHNLDSAAEHLEKASQLHPDSIGILAQLERVSIARRDYPRAVEVIEQLAQRDTDPRQYAARQLQLAQIKERLLDPPQSGASHYRAALQRVPDHPVALRAMELAYVRSGDAEALAQFYRREAMVVDDPVHRAQLFFKAGETAETKARQLELAKELYDQSIEAHAAYLPALRARRRVAERDDDPRTALRCIEAEGKATADAEHGRDLLFEAGRIHQDQFQDEAAAVEAFQAVLNRSPEHEPAFRRLEAIHLERGEHVATVRLYEKRAQAIPDPAQQAHLLADAGLVAQDKLGDEDRAVALYQQVLERESMNATALVRLGPLLFARGLWDQAIDVLHRTLALSKDPQILLRSFKSLGIIYQEHRPDLVKAVQSFQAALQSDPRDVDCLRRLSAVYTSAQDHASAINVLLRLADVTPDHEEKTRSLLQLGRLYEDGVRQPDNAILAYEKLLELEPSHQDAILRLCALHESREDWDALAEATGLYVRSLEPHEKPKAIPLHMKVADVFEKKIGDDGRAIHALQSVLEANPRDDVALERLAALYSKSPDSYPQAVDAHRRLLWNDPFRFESYHQMHQLFVKSNQYDKAFVVAQLLVYLRAADDEELFFFDEHKARVARSPDGTLSAKEHGRLVVHPAERGPVRQVMEVLSSELGKAFASDLGKYAMNPRSDRHGPKSDLPMRRLADEIAEVFQVPAFELWVTQQSDLELFLENEKPAALVMGSQFGRRLQDADQRFQMARQLERLKGGHQLHDQFSSRELEALLWAVAVLSGSSLRPQVDAGALDEMQRRLSKGLTASGRRQIQEAGASLFARKTDLDQYRAAAVHSANRAGLVMSNDIETAVRAIAKRHPDVRPVFRDPAQAAETIGSIPEVRELLAFAISEEYFTARARLRFSIQS
jgi:cellulose synthase operon protein C